MAGSISNKRINEKEEANPLQNLFKYFNQAFKDIRWPYTSAKEISHQGSQGQQGSGPERFTEQGIEASSQASGFPPRPYL